MEKCPKCGYVRTSQDDEFISELECPKCGIVYQKFTENISKEDNSEYPNDKDASYKTSDPPNKLIRFNLKIWSLTIVISIIIILVIVSMKIIRNTNGSLQIVDFDYRQVKEHRQQQVVVCLDRIDCVPPIFNSACSDKCREIFGNKNIDQYIRDGWSVVSSVEQVSTINLDKIDSPWSECSCGSMKYFIEK